MWKRSTDDPLIRLFLDTYNLNLLQVPRENAAVGDVYVYDGRRTSPPGNIRYLLDPPPDLPDMNIDERMADIEGVTSNSQSLSSGLGLLEGFLAAFGALPVAAKARADFEKKGAAKLRFRIGAPTRDSVDPYALGAALTRSRLADDNPWWSMDNRYYLTSAVARTSSISVVAEDDASSTVSIDVEALKIAGASSGLTVERRSESEIVYSGSRPLVFGVEVCEMSYNEKSGRLRLRNPEGAVRFKGGSSRSPDRPGPQAFIGEEDGDAFLELD